MWLFEAKYHDINTGKEIARTIEFDGDNFFSSERDCYIYAMSKAYDMKKDNECFSSLEFIAC